MKSSASKKIINDCLARGWVFYRGKYYTPGQALTLNIIPVKKSKHKTVKTGWIDDPRNIKNRNLKRDPFIALVEKLLGLEVWPEFYFDKIRLWRFDYCIPQHMIFIEVEGGVWTCGRHTRPQGFLNDTEKYNQATALGWKMLRVTPSTLLSEYTLELIKKTILLK